MNLTIKWIEGSLLVISLLLSLWWFIALWIGLFCKETEQKKYQTSTSHKFIAMIGLFSYILTLIFLFIGEMFYYSDYWIGYPYFMVSFCWGTGNTLTNILFMLRIHDIFHKTMYKSSIFVYILLIISLISYWLLQAIGVSLVEAFLTYNVLPLETTFKIGGILIFSEAIAEQLTVITMLYLFISKLMKLSLSQMDDIYHMIHINDEQDLSLNIQQKRLLNIVTKLTILVGFGLATSQIGEFYGVMEAYFFSKNSNIDPDILHFILIALMILDSVINSFVVFLSFSRNGAWYYRICICCHNCCNSCCLYIVKQKMIKAIMVNARSKKYSSMTAMRANSTSVPLLNVQVLQETDT